jgi:membrane-bound lytic murein transglycosylase B
MRLSRRLRFGIGVLAVACLVRPGAGAVTRQGPPVPLAETPRPPFDEWLAAVRAEALARGIREQVLADALDGVQPLAIVLERDQTQPEFRLSLDSYLKRRVTATTVRAARRELARHRAVLGRVQRAFGIDPATLISVWGLESTFGRFSGVRPTIPTLATLAYDERRSALFRAELFEALGILDRGEIELARMKGSWAGAMGQPQFMPSSFTKFAVDFDGDRRKDIWASPADIFGSIGNYLKAHGWTPGERWGREVSIPATAAPRIDALFQPRTAGCRAVRGLSEPQPLDRWRAAGLRLRTGGPVPAGTRPASLLQVSGRTFLVYRNYEAILGYNCAHTYALSVLLLADRIGR